jgi:serine/threonine-protein kinase
MSITSVETLLSVLRRVQILAPEQIDEVARVLGPHYTDPVELGRYLVDAEWLTPFQYQALFGGNWDELSIGPYQLLARIGEGGVSEVFKAWDSTCGRIVALKVLRRNLARHSDAARQFERELQAVTRLNHPNVIKTHDALQLGSMHYFAMEYVEGMDLQRHVEEAGPLPIELACEYIRQVAQGLQHAHQIGLVHRDIKPANLLLINPPPRPDQPAPPAPPGKRLDPVVKILDWGLARVLATEGEPHAVAESDLDDEKGALIGTADYISPEQARDARLVDTRADLYSLGCTFFYLLTGRPPFLGACLMQKLRSHQEAAPPAVTEHRPDVPAELSAMIQRMLCKQPENRYQIPLLLIAQLRPFCPNSGGVVGSLIRPMNGAVPRPASAPTMIRPAS